MAFLTKLEELFMLAVFYHNEPVNLMDIRDYLFNKSGKDWAIASLYIALDKLKKKGLVKSFKGEHKHARGGKALRYYFVSKRGIQILEQSWKMQEGMWRDFISSSVRSNQTNE